MKFGRLKEFGNYWQRRFIRTMIKSIILIVLLTLLSFANKTILTAPLVHVGQLNGTMIWLTLSQIFGIYLGIQYVEACIDVLYFYVFQGGWKLETSGKIPTKIASEPLNLEALRKQFGKLQEDFRRLSIDLALLEEE